MNELERQVRDASTHLEPAWTERRAHDTWCAIEVRRARRTPRRLVALACVACALLLAATVLWLRDAPPEAVDSPSEGAQTVELRLAPHDAALVLGNGATVQAVSGPISLTVLADDHVALNSGQARFEASDAPLVVRVGATELQVAPEAIFRVVPAAHASDLELSVEQGLVTVIRDGAPPETHSARVETPTPQAPAPRVTHTDAVPGAPEPPPLTAPTPPAPSDTDWRRLADRGAFDQAFERLRDDDDARVRNTPRDLMLAADAARLSGHPAEAVPWLTRVVDEHATDARAPQAAFTLGRLYLESLGEPRRAAEAFARVGALAPSSPLAEDALAREAQAWHAAHRPTEARSAARRYLERYPDGRRRSAVEPLLE